jgi:hypothetical protein
MAAAPLPALSPEEKTAVLNALKRVLSADRLSHARRTAQRICALERVIAALEEPENPVDFGGLVPLFEAVIIASRGEKPTTH